MTTTFGMFVKYPEPGRVKTRLAETIGQQMAAELYAGFLRDLVRNFQDVGERRVLAFTPDTVVAREYVQRLAGEDFDLWPQPEGDLGQRLEQFFTTFGPGPVVVIGSDSPTLPTTLPRAALTMLENYDAVLGPATDGGLYLIGLRQTGKAFSRADSSPVFRGIDWSTSRVLEQMARRLEEQGARLSVLPPWYDVDDPPGFDFLCGHLEAWRIAGDNALYDVAATRAVLDDIQRTSPL